MPKFNYVAADTSGKEVKSFVEADSREKAVDTLKRSGYIVISMNEQNMLSQDIHISFLEKKPKPRDLAVFCRQFVSIISAGVTILSALEMLAEQTENNMLRTALSEIKRSVEKGESLSSSMREHRKIFPDYFITMIQAGEVSGSLEVSFTRMAVQFEKDAHLKGLIIKASVYPIVLALVAVGVIIGVLTFVIPTFQSMFDSMSIQLPLITRIVIAMSHFVQNNFIILVAAIIGFVVFIMTFSKTDNGKHFFGKIQLHLPLFGTLAVKSSSARMARTLCTLLASGIPLIEALEITASTMTNVYFQEALLFAKSRVDMGSSLHDPLAQNKLFPPLVCHMIKIGEESGSLDNMLSSLADYYDDEVELATQTLMAALEPAIIILMAGIIGTIVMAIMLPMASMYQGLDSM